MEPRHQAQAADEDRLEALYAAWQAADRRASDAEDRLRRAFLEANCGLAEPPSSQLIDEAERLRDIAGQRIRAVTICFCRSRFK